jgi:hypothetical protein
MVLLLNFELKLIAFAVLMREALPSIRCSTPVAWVLTPGWHAEAMRIAVSI